jgi:hypothetical protein
VQSSASGKEGNGNGNTNVLDKESLLAAMRLHQEIETKTSSVDGEDCVPRRVDLVFLVLRAFVNVWSRVFFVNGIMM